MIAYAKKVFTLSKPDKDGTTLRDHLESIERQMGKRPEELELPAFPDLLEPLWRIFIVLSNSRSQGFNGPSEITLRDIQSYIELFGEKLNTKEIETLFKLDKEFLAIMRKDNG